MAKKVEASNRVKPKKVAKRTAPSTKAEPRRRAAPRTESSPREATEANAARPGHISIRMYNNILGDCFLIRIPGGKREVKILIDCGVLQGMPGAADIMGEIAADIARTTDSHLDVLVVTHEHWDHLSGFSQAQEVFSKFRIDELWLAWTENDKDADAAMMRSRRRKALALLLTLDKHFGPTAAPEDDPDSDEIAPVATQKDDLRELLAFTGEAPLGAAATAKMTTDEILKKLKKRASKVRYFTPGADPIALPHDVPVRAYVLGPPKDTKLLLRSNPRKGEVYLRGEPDEFGGYLAAALQLDKQSDAFDADERNAFEMAMPFASYHFRALSRMEPPPGADGQGYFARRDEWRRVDRDWLGAAEQLALKLDSDTNNTSLVLAFVFGKEADRRVLLFPGDAQVGNWESWQQYIWPHGAHRDDPHSVDISKLLASTVFYKVGHHASHNATLRAGGLELMTNPDLVAMIPVKEEFARKTKHWNMPFPSLLARLLEKTKGRVLRADKSLADLKADSSKRVGKPGELSEEDWNDFYSRVTEGPTTENGEVPLFVQYYIPL
ncbi:MBL fold metallo-hydrolase [Rhodopseudomonas sp. BR0G17]|uniref:MBL fold metallo-hydrolase n=1 Tax=Rhodopseudomonas sp. BR0G17 TaxID=2269368 RepID=UPI0013DF69F8|nr:MBL fold metallo-hydrolase [Rhodopseudomonas sp. BR0G17]